MHPVPLLLIATRLMVSGAHAEKDEVDRLLDIVTDDRDIPWTDRQAAKQKLIALPHDRVMPKLAPRIINAPKEWSIGITTSGLGAGGPDTPPGQQAFWALQQVWYEHTMGPKPETYPDDLIRYLGQPEFRGMERTLVREIGHRWIPAAELVIVKIFRDEKQPAEMRFTAGNALGTNARDKYLIELLEFIENVEYRWNDSLTLDLLRGHRPRYKGTPGDERLLQVAQRLLEREIKATGKLSSGYHTASAIGAFVGQNDFAPDQDDPKFRKPGGGLTDEFFEAPVIAARLWLAEHGKKRATTTGPQTSPAGP